ncbi:MAG TPA: hypothetical protein VGP47_11250 [Parachlamydiaceae bacterium]|nr:hypothetical protein [Parachlamydiaceae bacterium]
MKIFKILLLSIGCLLFASATPVHSYESYKVVSVSKYMLKNDYYKVKGNQFVFNKDLYVTFNQFNSIADFHAIVMYNGASHWASYEMNLRSDPYLGCNEVRGGSFGIRDAGGFHGGDIVIGKSITREVLNILKESQELVFEGASSFSGTPILLTIDTSSGRIYGNIGEYLVESSPKEFDGSFEAAMYTLGEDGLKIHKGGLIFNIYGEDRYILAGAYQITFGSVIDLVFLSHVN